MRRYLQKTMERNVVYQYVPPRLYAFLVGMQSEYNLSIQEVMTTILRKGVQEFLGFSCPHERIRTAKKTGLPYCFDCWTRMQQVTAATVDYKGKVKKEGTYKPIPTFLEEMEERNMVSTGTSTESHVPNVRKTDII